jgi:hypothetical protein
MGRTRAGHPGRLTAATITPVTVGTAAAAAAGASQRRAGLPPRSGPAARRRPDVLVAGSRSGGMSAPLISPARSRIAVL